MNIYSKISKKGQIKVPKTIRKDLGLGENEVVLFIVEKEGIKNQGVLGGTAKEMAGSLKKYAKKYEPLDEIRPKIQEQMDEAAAKDPN